MHLGDLEASNSARPPGIVSYLEIEETSKAVGRYRVHGKHLITDGSSPDGTLEFHRKIIGETSATTRPTINAACRIVIEHNNTDQVIFAPSFALLFLWEERKLIQQRDRKGRD